jgi:C-terminal processing protease CtpA/Prc
MIMKKLLNYLVLAGLMLTAASCVFLDDQSTPQGYVRHCVRLLDRQALYADSPEWQEKKKEVLAKAKALADMDGAHALVGEAARVAGGKHSSIVPPVKDTASYPEIAPEVKMMDGNIAYVLLPAHMGVKVSDSLYKHTVLNFLESHADAAGVVVDLRDNRGGNMYPMIAAVSPLLPDGIILRFKNRKRTSPIFLDFVLSSEHISKVQKFPTDVPVAILTDDWTASSGEAVLLCFRGLPNVRTFGIPTAGYASANIPYGLADGYRLVVTTSCDMARTGEVFCDDPIAPDVQTEDALGAALAWLKERL